MQDQASATNYMPKRTYDVWVSRSDDVEVIGKEILAPIVRFFEQAYERGQDVELSRYENENGLVVKILFVERRERVITHKPQPKIKPPR